MYNILKISAIFFLSVLLVTSCRDDDDSPTPDPKNDHKAEVTFNLSHSVNGENVKLESFDYTNSAGNIYSIHRLRYFISEFRFHKADGGVYHADTFLFVNINNPETHKITLKDVAVGDYQSISFIFGLDSVRNQSMNLPNVSDYNNMEWPHTMGGGYHYMMLEGFYKEHPDSSAFPYNTHTGRLHDNENFIHIMLDNSSVNLSANSHWDVYLDKDINEWYDNPNLYDFTEIPSGIMNNQPVQTMLKENGQTVFSVINKSER